MTWKQQLENEMKYQDDPGPVIAYHPDEAAFDGPGVAGRDDLLAWTEQRVYHLSIVDETGEMDFESAPRNPQGCGS